MPDKPERQSTEKRRNRLFPLFLLFPLSQILLMIGIFLPSQASLKPLQILVPVLLCVASDAALAAALRYISRRASLQAENRIMEQRLEEQTHYYAALSEHYRAVRRVRHDIDNHLYTIRILAEDGRTEEAIRYADALEEKLDKLLRREGLES